MRAVESDKASPGQCLLLQEASAGYTLTLHQPSTPPSPLLISVITSEGGFGFGIGYD